MPAHGFRVALTYRQMANHSETSVDCPQGHGPLTRGARRWVCEECGHLGPSITPAAATSLDALPSILAIARRDQLAEANPVLRLWHACDAVELLLRFSVAVGIGALGSGDRALPPSLRRALRDTLLRPTLGQWRRAAQVVLDASAAGDAELVPELRALVAGKVSALLDGEPPRTPERSFLSLRNRLAHGGGITHPAASRLLALWEPRIDDLFVGEHFWGDVLMIVRRDEGRWLALAGPSPEGREAQLEGSVMQALTALPVGKPALIRGGRAQPLWPMVLHGVPRGTEGGGEGKRDVPQVYSRRGEVEPLYTPIGSDEVLESGGDESAAREIDRMMELEEEPAAFSVAGFEAQIRSDAAILVGRAEERERIAALLLEAPGGVHWIPGPAGAGKSMVLAAAVAEALDRAPPRTSILAYRFRAGDPRCSRSEFLRFAIERVDPLVPSRVRGAGVADLATLRHRLLHLRDARVVFALDGMDEIAERDPTFARQVVWGLAAVDGVTWVCAGRSERGLGEDFANASSPFDGRSLPPMSDADVRAMILERLGRARARIVANDKDRGGRVTNAFVDAICERAAGVPIYVRYVIADLLGRRIRPEPGSVPELPASLAEYHQRVVERIGVGSLALIATPIVMTLGLAREPLSPVEIEAILGEGWQLLSGESDPAALVHRALGALESVVRRQDGVQAPRFALFHHSFREHLSTSVSTAGAFRTARARVGTLAASAPRAGAPLERYLLRWAVHHLLEIGDEPAVARLRALLDGAFVVRWAEVQHPEAVLDDLVAAHGALTPNSPAPAALVAWLAHSRTMTPESVHAWLVYRRDLRLYEEFLELARRREVWVTAGLDTDHAARAAAAYEGRLANLLRRRGELARASELLERCAVHWEPHRDAPGGAAELSGVLYDRGYVAYLRGEAEDARQWLSQSADVAARSGNEISASISRCVEAVVAATFGGAAEAERARQVLDDAMAVFERYAAADPNAERWVQNVLAHRIEVAVSLEDRPAAEASLRALERHPWARRYGDPETLALARARVARLQGDWAEAERELRLAIGERPDPRREQLARIHLEIAEIRLLRGDLAGAHSAIAAARALPADCGNAPWQVRAAALLSPSRE